MTDPERKTKTLKKLGPDAAIVRGPDGLKRLCIKSGGWKPKYLDAVLNDGGLAAVEIWTALRDLSFLEQFPPGLKVITLWLSAPPSLEVLERFSDLETLTMNLDSRAGLPVDFAAFPRLRVLLTDWNRGFGSLFEADLPRLEGLYLSGQPHETLQPYACFSTLNALRFGQGTKLRSTAGLAPWIECLEVYRERNLSELSFEPGLGLTRLELSDVRALNQLDGIESLELLRWLGIKNSGPIASLTPIAGLSKLEEFYAWESTLVEDGDLTILRDLPKLKTVALQSRRHYRPSVSDLRGFLESRAAGTS